METIDTIIIYLGATILILILLVTIGHLLVWTYIHWTRFGKLLNNWQEITPEDQIKIKRIIHKRNNIK